MSAAPTLLWFRRDLRVDDHPALLAAAAGDRPVLGLFLVDDHLLAGAGAARRHFLAASLTALDDALGGRLLILGGKPSATLPRLAREVGATQIHISADYGPYGARRDERVRTVLADQGIELVATGSPYAVAPGRVRKPDGGAYAVFTPFHRAWTDHGWRAPAGSGSGAVWLDPTGLGVKARAATELAAGTPPAELPAAGEPAATTAWTAFRDGPLADYDSDRDRPDRHGTSRLSVYLKWGTLHPRTLLHDLAQRRGPGPAGYRRELAWRDFYAEVLHQHPDSPTRSVDPIIDRMTWSTGAAADRHAQAWRDGRTGYPIVDAGLRQLLAEGWMHNRVRMIVASFLIKDLHLPWQVGAAHFMEHLVDGDLASNTGGWQWVAGSGPQAAPFFRVFNPTLQGEKYDPTGDYVRRYVPELRPVDGKAVHQPWKLPDGVPAGYPDSIVNHTTEREVTLQRWADRPR